MENIIGDKFGYLTAIKEAGFVYSGSPQAKRRYKKRLYECRCDCGSLVTLRRDALISGNTKSCGCKTNELNASVKFNDLSGQRFGRLTVREHLGKISSHHIWKCECECGKIVEVRASNLVTSTTQSCGCFFKDQVTKHGLSNDPIKYREYRWSKQPSLKLKHRVSNAVRKSIKDRGGKKGGRTFDFLPYTVAELKEHLEGLWEPWMNWTNYGGNLSDAQRTWHIDHIKPQVSFNFDSMADPEFLECWALSNLRPLEKMENARKGINY